MNTRPYVHDDPVPDTSTRGKSGYGFTHITGLVAVATALAAAMLMS